MHLDRRLAAADVVETPEMLRCAEAVGQDRGGRIGPVLATGRRSWLGCVVALLVAVLSPACATSDDGQTLHVSKTGIVGSWSGPTVQNQPTPKATAVLLSGARPAVVEAVGSEVRVLEPDGDRLTATASHDMGAPIAFMQPRVDGDSVVVLAQTCPAPLSTADTIDRDCPSMHVGLVTFAGDALDVSAEDVPLDGVPNDLAVLRSAVAVTTTVGFFVRPDGGDWRRVAELPGSACATDEAHVEVPGGRAVAPTTIAAPEPVTVPGESIQVRPLPGGALTDHQMPGRIIGGVTCAPGGYLLAVATSTGLAAGVTFWGAPGLGTPKQLHGPTGAMPAIEGQLSRGQWAKSTVGTRRTVFIDPTTGEWFAATGMKGSETPPYAIRSGDRGVVFAPVPGGGTWVLRTYDIAR